VKSAGEKKLKFN